MLDDDICDYAAYLRLDLSSNFQTVQDVIDNMITRLEELTSVVQMIKSKNSDCSSIVSEDICKYRNEIGTLSKKVLTLSNVVLKLQMNMDVIEKQVEKAEFDFGLNSDNKLKNFLMPFFKRSKGSTPMSTEVEQPVPQEKLEISSVLDNFDNTEI